jgi:hypothetical protein
MSGTHIPLPTEQKGEDQIVVTIDSETNSKLEKIIDLLEKLCILVESEIS